MHIAVDMPQAFYVHNVSHQTTENFLLHTHETYELYYFISGEADYLIEGQEYHLRPHTLLLIAPNLFHGIRVHTNAAYDRHTLHFDPSVLSLDHRVMLLSVFPHEKHPQTQQVPYCLEDMEHSGVLALFRAMEACHGQSENVIRTMMPVLTEAILGLVALCIPSLEQGEALRERTGVSRTQKDIIEYLDAHFTEPITLDMLSERFFISKHYLNRAFRKATGTTVMDYLIHKRVTYVQQLLVNGIPVSQAASLAGFGDYTSFYRAYVKRFGHAPSQDRGTPIPAQGRDVFHVHGVLRDQKRNGALSEERCETYDGLVDENVRFWQKHALQSAMARSEEKPHGTHRTLLEE